MKKEKITLSIILRRLIPISLKASPIFMISTLLIGVLHGVSHGFNTFMTANLFDSVTSAIESGGGTSTVFLMALALGLTLIGVQVLNGLHNFMQNQLHKKITGVIRAIAHDKASRLEPVLFESTDVLDDINKAQQGINNGIFLLLIFFSIFTFYIPYLMFMGFYLFTLKPSLVWILLLIFIPIMFSQLIRSHIFTKFEDKAAPLRREMDYYETCVCSRELFRETRLLGAYDFFKSKFLDTIRLFSKEVWKAEKKTGGWELAMKSITMAGYAGILVMLVTSLLRGEISVGSFAAVFSSIGMMFGIMEEIICRHIGSLTKNFGTVGNLIRMFDMPERKSKGAVPDFSNEGIVLNHVSFTYPSKDNPSVDDVSLTIRPGETLAIVGLNGAGKSTLVKLLTGLYLPDKGSLAIGGVKAADAGMNVFHGLSGVFQQYGQYKMTLGENISISDPKGDAQNRTALEKAAANADVALPSPLYPEGLDTMLSKEFDGVDVSGGQWQRIAIARGLYRPHGMIVLDEPTSAIDPIEETKIYNKFAEISRGVLSVIVTHRLGSARIADRIAVMDAGKIVEIGSHEDLITAGGLYAKLWNAQAQYYV